MDNSELLHMLEVPESLKSKVEEAVTVLRDHQVKEQDQVSPLSLPLPFVTVALSILSFKFSLPLPPSLHPLCCPLCLWLQ